MKKMLLFFLLLLSLPQVAMADSVFELELECAQRTIRSGRTNYISLQFAQFQESALLYLQEKQLHTRDTARINRRWLDQQALDMADFLSIYYISFVNDTLSAEDHEVLRLIFRDASLSTPCFYDANERNTLQFLTPEEKSVTPFSLDTDWTKAIAKLRSELMTGTFQWLPRQYDEMRRKLSVTVGD